MLDADHVRLGRIADKLAAARAMPVPPDAFGVEKHGFKLGTPLPEAVVAEFEERHEVALPPEYRLFVTELGDGGAGPGYHLSRLSESCDGPCRPGHLARPSPYLPGPRYFGDWEERYEEAPGPDQVFLPGTLAVAYHGCSLSTQLVVTGPARGRLFNVDAGSLGPYVVEDADFVAWYERWLDEVIGGYHIGWMFGERLPLDEPGLIAVLGGDPSPERRARAGESLLQLPGISDSAWAALSDAMAADASAAVRVTAWHSLRSRRREHQRWLDDAEAVEDEIARYARSRTPPDLEALDRLRRLTFADVLAELADHDLERRRRAAPAGLARLGLREVRPARPARRHSRPPPERHRSAPTPARRHRGPPAAPCWPEPTAARTGRHRDRPLGPAPPHPSPRLSQYLSGTCRRGPWVLSSAPAVRGRPEPA